MAKMTKKPRPCSKEDFADACAGEDENTPAIARERERAVGAIIDNGLSAPIPCGNVAMSVGGANDGIPAPGVAPRTRRLHRRRKRREADRQRIKIVALFATWLMWILRK
jgi:hypothetical protein